ncbi:glucocorticoid-induced transcript 1 protein-like isoform X1 [Chiloscyllium plagiosum]|uniref:glucocorticoid-induced transcript 1 protein-like isoform X1 n=1 Tax=Chiloscyllium plagiosum TaxID=36176 RepID=UPI001CB7E46D|nr:glucocorticoid-induced transcript 1 protein-like isoform X1 [Chiloscyllium plagiosum]
MSSQVAPRVRPNGSPTSSRPQPLRATVPFQLRAAGGGSSSNSPVGARLAPGSSSAPSPAPSVSPPGSRSAFHSVTTSTSTGPGPGEPEAAWRSAPSGERKGSYSTSCCTSPVSKAVEKPKTHQTKSCIRRTSSLDTIIGPYLIGQWPRDTDVHATWENEKATQTPSTWHEIGLKRKNSHKRSASWGSADQLKEIAKLRQQLQRTKLSKKHGKDKERQSPLHGDHAALGVVQQGTSKFVPILPANLAITKLIPRLRNSLEAINQEIEGMFIKEPGDKELLKIMEAPDGHRAPFPSQRHSSSSQSEPSPIPLEQTSGYSSPSPYPSPSPSPSYPNGSQEEGPCIIEDVSFFVRDKDSGTSSPLLKYASSPKPNHSYMFKREPPEGCERVTAFEETPTISFGQALLYSCPDKNKVNFNPTGSAFCPVHILKPLLPTVDLILRHLPTSASSTPSSTGGSSSTLTSCQSTTQVSFQQPLEDSGTTDFTELSKEQPLQFDPWKLAQAEEGAFFQSSLVI